MSEKKVLFKHSLGLGINMEKIFKRTNTILAFDSFPSKPGLFSKTNLLKKFFFHSRVLSYFSTTAKSKVES